MSHRQYSNTFNGHGFLLRNTVRTMLDYQRDPISPLRKSALVSLILTVAAVAHMMEGVYGGAPIWRE